jgi:hypothetical protein
MAEDNGLSVGLVTKGEMAEDNGLIREEKWRNDETKICKVKEKR